MSFSRAIRCAPVVVALLLAMAYGLARGADGDDEEETATKPGLLAHYSGGAQRAAQFSRYESLPTFLLTDTQSPDPRLEPTGWNVTWEGLIRVARPGKYRFAAVHSGPLEIEVAGKSVLSQSAAAKKLTAGKAVQFPFGRVPLKIHFECRDPGAVLKIYWQAEGAEFEPLEPHLLLHAAKGAEVADAFAAGRLTVEEHNCLRCHTADPKQVKVAAQLTSRPGPKLTDAGDRLKAGWIYHWLADPQALRPEAVMPRLFSADRRGELERYAVAVYLASQGELSDVDDKLKEEAEIADGKRLFNQTGCVVCHAPHGSTTCRATLTALSRKTNTEALAEFLRKPEAIDPAGRMPNLKVSELESQSLAQYLIHRDQAQAPQLDLPAEPPAAEWNTLPSGDGKQPAGEVSAEAALDAASRPTAARLAAIARRVIQEKRCANCHEFQPHGDSAPLAATPAKSDLAAIARTAAAHPESGCLAPATAQCRGDVPVFGASLERPAAVAFVSVAPHIPGTAAPGETARLALQRFNCTGCHRRDAEGGLAADVVALLVQNQTPDAAELVNPPTLTGVVDKLREEALVDVLIKGRRSRPWMTLRMPEFPKDDVAVLPAELSALDGDPLNDAPPKEKLDKPLAEAGRRLVGSRGFGCTKCHDMLGVVSTGTRGPDLANVARRVNHPWYNRWMIDPQQIQPGTRMPTVFLNGASPFSDVLGGDPAKQRLAIWEYLSHAKQFPPPDGLEAPKTGDVLAGGGEYQTLRTFMHDTTARSMAIRFADGVHLCYDMQACRLAYAWSGEFLDLNPVWGGRGGGLPGIKGSVFWHSPAGFPWDVTLSPNTVPDFSTHGNDTSLGAALPHDGKLYSTRLDFHGYQLTEHGPTFRYELHLDGDHSATFRERVVSLVASAAGANGALQNAEVSAPPDRTIWLQAALAETGGGGPQWIGPGGTSGQLDAADKTAPADAAIRCVQDGKPLVLHLRAAPPGAVWSVVNHDNQFYVLLHFPAAGPNSPVRLSLAVLSPTGDPAATQAAELQAK